MKTEENYDKEEWGGWKIVSDMLDHPDENGIYPTSKCYQKLYEFVVAQKDSAYRAGVEKCVEAVAEETKGEYWPAQFDERFSEEKYKLENKKEALHADAEIKLWIMELLILKEIAMFEKLEALRK